MQDIDITDIAELVRNLRINLTLLRSKIPELGNTEFEAADKLIGQFFDYDKVAKEDREKFYVLSGLAVNFLKYVDGNTTEFLIFLILSLHTKFVNKVPNEVREVQ